MDPIDKDAYRLPQQDYTVRVRRVRRWTVYPDPGRLSLSVVPALENGFLS